MDIPSARISTETVENPGKMDGTMSASVQLMRNTHLAKLEASMVDNKPLDESSDIDEGYQTHTGNHSGPGYVLRQNARPEHQKPQSQSHQQQQQQQQQQLGSEFDYAGAARASYFGRRVYPTYDPSHANACPLRFIKQFEHAAQHNGLQPKAWAKRLNSCLYGRAEDWAFDESPLEVSGHSWDMRKRQFLDWALLPAEQELRRQRLLRFYQAESDLSIDYVYSFEEVARGLRDFKEDVWVRKCIANLVSPIRTALFELWPDGLPVRFRDLRDSLYAVDWGLYEAASIPLKVVRYGAPYVYETYTVSHPTPAPTPASRASTSSNERLHYQQQQQASRPSMSISVNRVYSPPAPSPAPLSAAKKKRPVLSTATMGGGGHNRGTPNSASASGTLSPRVSTESHSNKTSLDVVRGGVSVAASAATATTPNAAALNTGLYELVSTLSRISDKERNVIMTALEKMAAVSAEDPNAGSGDGLGVTGGGLPAPARASADTVHVPASTATAVRPPTATARQQTSRAAAAAATIAATTQLACVDSRPGAGVGALADEGLGSGQASSRSSAANDRHVGAAQSRLTDIMRLSTESTDPTQPPAGKIRLRTRPLTSMACCSHRTSSPIIDSRRDISDGAVGSAAHAGVLDIPAADGNLPAGEQPEQNGGSGGGERESPRKTHARKLSSRKSDSALTTATRSMRHAENMYYRDSADNALRSPEFTVLHPAIDLRPPHTRRGRFAFIKKLSHMLTPH
ncbi:hypothetical protein LPJ53_001034 [Coemansia erecta]|uniref:Uncharacterized protein n=1 Tax=Coemansia erecta TaxID=147472 RepID=A0A9W8CUJ6_9FUNG|nr:hypothetical protein LPJ53_001034 [Coemansia erecta]